MGTVYSDSGATHHNVNNMILFTNNTRHLAEMRNAIYAFYYERHEPVGRDQIEVLFASALAQYKKEFYSSDLEGEDLDDYNACVTFTDEQKQEFITLMVSNYDSWKFDRDQFKSTPTTLLRAKTNLYKEHGDEDILYFSKDRLYFAPVPVTTTDSLYNVTVIGDNGRKTKIGEWCTEFELLDPNTAAAELYTASQIFSKYYRPIMAEYGQKYHNNPLTPVIVEAKYVPGQPNIAYEISKSRDETNPLYGVTLLEYHPETQTITQHPDTGPAHSISEAYDIINKLSPINNH